MKDTLPLPETIRGNLYDHPKYYDIVFGSDWKAERDFLQACFARFGKRPVRRVFEPACGTGRLLVKLAAAGYDVAGNDLNERAVNYCNARLARHGFPATAVVGDMADFRVHRKFDAAFNMINSFRHLPDEQAAVGHLESMAAALVQNGLYLLGLHLTPTAGIPLEEESWSARRGHLGVVSQLWTKGVDLTRRVERVGMTFDIYTPTRSFRIEDELAFRTYTANQMSALIKKVKRFEIVETFDFAYDIEAPIDVGPASQDVVYVLRKQI